MQKPRVTSTKVNISKLDWDKTKIEFSDAIKNVQSLCLIIKNKTWVQIYTSKTGKVEVWLNGMTRDHALAAARRWIKENYQPGLKVREGKHVISIYHAEEGTLMRFDLGIKRPCEDHNKLCNRHYQAGYHDGIKITKKGTENVKKEIN